MKFGSQIRDHDNNSFKQGISLFLFGDVSVMDHVPANSFPPFPSLLKEFFPEIKKNYIDPVYRKNTA